MTVAGVRNALLESEDNECPDCNEKGTSPGSLIPNRFLRTAVNAFRNETGYGNKLRESKNKEDLEHSGEQPEVNEDSSVSPKQHDAAAEKAFDDDHKMIENESFKGDAAIDECEKNGDADIEKNGESIAELEQIVSFPDLEENEEEADEFFEEKGCCCFFY